MTTVIYGVDIAVYKLGSRSQVVGRKKFAWARLEMPPNPGVLNPSDITAEVTGLELPRLASSIAADVRNKAGVALGFEAPMWTPAPAELPNQGLVFAARYKEEKEADREWYKQSGAAATLKALTLGKLLFSLLIREGMQLKLTTERIPPTTGKIFLYEAFVTGDYVTPHPKGFSQDSWDAVTAALAYSGTILRHKIFGYRAIEFGPSKLPSTQVFSHWATIAGASGLDAHACAGSCPVVALRVD